MAFYDDIAELDKILEEANKQYEIKKCDTRACDHPPVFPQEGTLDQSFGTLPALIYSCECGWTRYEPRPRPDGSDHPDNGQTPGAAG